ncbi:hypothetical protein ACPPVO_06745 [Dactylosporangium sp. McL0621]|uniref:hypothetical protein n=1 Tax=Dactylosporangium sp. McL0621 TaxID=3415678 RepID=UPI003CEA9089
MRGGEAIGGAARFGFATFGAYVADRVQQGLSMAAVSREAGLHKDWVGRHAPVPDRPAPGERRLGPVGRARGFEGVAAYLRAAHLDEHRSVAAIAAEAGTSRWTVLAALRHHGVEAVAHAAKRHGARQRGQAVAARFGFATFGDYVVARRADGWAGDRLARESGIAASSLRRHAQAT